MARPRQRRPVAQRQVVTRQNYVPPQPAAATPPQQTGRQGGAPRPVEPERPALPENLNAPPPPERPTPPEGVLEQGGRLTLRQHQRGELDDRELAALHQRLADYRAELRAWQRAYPEAARLYEQRQRYEIDLARYHERRADYQRSLALWEATREREESLYNLRVADWEREQAERAERQAEYERQLAVYQERKKEYDQFQAWRAPEFSDAWLPEGDRIPEEPTALMEWLTHPYDRWREATAESLRTGVPWLSEEQVREYADESIRMPYRVRNLIHLAEIAEARGEARPDRVRPRDDLGCMDVWMGVQGRHVAARADGRRARRQSGAAEYRQGELRGVWFGYIPTEDWLKHVRAGQVQFLRA